MNNQGGNVHGKDDGFRRKWNLVEYHMKAQMRSKEKIKAGKASIKNHKLPVDNAPNSDDPSEKPLLNILKAREYLVDLEKQVGKSFVINSTVGSMADGGYYCDVCDCSLRDSSNFLDHINGKKHQANLGISMKVERSSVDQVKSRIAAITKKKNQERDMVQKEYDLDESIAATKAKNEQERKQRRQEKKLMKEKQKKQFEEDIHMGMDDEKEEMMRVMGFSSFGSSKK